MTRREKILGLSLISILAVFAHAFLIVHFKKGKVEQLAEIDQLQINLSSYSTIKGTEQLIQEEVDWVDSHTPPPASFQDVQTDLQNFLVSSSKSLGFSPYSQKLISKSDAQGIENIFQRVQIQISARATEKQIYEWLVKIHQPEKMRALSYLKLSPPVNDSDLINCQLIAELYSVVK